MRLPWIERVAFSSRCVKINAHTRNIIALKLIDLFQIQDQSCLQIENHEHNAFHLCWQGLKRKKYVMQNHHFADARKNQPSSSRKKDYDGSPENLLVWAKRYFTMEIWNSSWQTSLMTNRRTRIYLLASKKTLWKKLCFNKPITIPFCAKLFLELGILRGSC